MLGLIGIHQNAHENHVNYVTVFPLTKERINLQPWCIVEKTPATKTSPEKITIVKPASQEELKYYADKGDRRIGELPEHIAKTKKAMYDKALAEYNKASGVAAATASAPVSDNG